MSRNRGTIDCACGYTLQLRNATTRPMTFEEYMKVIGEDEFRYEDEFDWISYSCRSTITGETIVWGLDTSYWYAFNDDPSERDRLSIPI
jgi:hypothetical protein